MNELLELAACYRAAQLYAHTAHHLAKGPTFLIDHKMFGDFYPAYEKAFDSLCERALGLGKAYSAAEIQQSATKRLLPGLRDTEPGKFFERLLGFEAEFQDEIKELMKAGQSDGVQDLLQALAGEAQDRVYRIKRRLM